MGEIGIDWQVLFSQIVNIVMLVAFICFIIWLVIKLYRNSKNRSPMDIARSRYAKGKITLEEFDQVKRELSKE